MAVVSLGLVGESHGRHSAVVDSVEERSTGMAYVLGAALPGAGDLYLGDDRGAIFFGAAASALAIGWAASDVRRDCPTLTRRPCDLKPLYVGVSIAGWAWFVSMVDLVHVTRTREASDQLSIRPDVRGIRLTYRF